MNFKYITSLLTAVVGLTVSAETAIADVIVRWQPGDNSANIQQAIDSGDSTVIIPKANKPWAVANPLYANTPNQKIIFEPGVVLQAQKGAFKHKYHSMMTVLADGVTLSGYDATFKMRKADYLNTELYEESEWRHNISIRGAQNFIIEGLTLRGAGGDGIYVGSGLSPGKTVPDKRYSSGIIRDVLSANNYRQGLSIVSAKDLLVENSTFQRTMGTNPASGVDLEPNHDWEKLVNIRFNNNKFNRNERNGIKIALWHYYGSEVSDISIVFDGCQSKGNGRYGIDIQGIDDGVYDGPKGSITFKDCKIANSGEHGIFIRNDQVNPDETFDIIFDNTLVRNAGINSEKFFAVQLHNTFEPGGISNIDFGDNFLIKDSKNRPPLVASYFAKEHGLSNIHGKITVENPYIQNPELGDNLANVTLEFSNNTINNMD